jgi:hypothetical protein
LNWLATPCGKRHAGRRAQRSIAPATRAASGPGTPSARRARQASASASVTCGSEDRWSRRCEARSRVQHTLRVGSDVSSPAASTDDGARVSVSSSARARPSWRAAPSWPARAATAWTSSRLAFMRTADPLPGETYIRRASSQSMFTPATIRSANAR